MTTPLLVPTPTQAEQVLLESMPAEQWELSMWVWAESFKFPVPYPPEPWRHEAERYRLFKAMSLSWVADLARLAGLPLDPDGSISMLEIHEVRRNPAHPLFDTPLGRALDHADSKRCEASNGDWDWGGFSGELDRLADERDAEAAAHIEAMEVLAGYSVRGVVNTPEDMARVEYVLRVRAERNAAEADAQAMRRALNSKALGSIVKLEAELKAEQHARAVAEAGEVEAKRQAETAYNVSRRMLEEFEQLHTQHAQELAEVRRLLAVETRMREQAHEQLAKTTRFPPAF